MLKASTASESSGELEKIRISGPTPSISDSAGLRLCVHFQRAPKRGCCRWSRDPSLSRRDKILGVHSPSSAWLVAPWPAEGQPGGPVWRKWRCFPKRASHVKCRGRVLWLGPPPRVLLLGSWEQNHLSSTHIWRVLFFIQEQHGKQEFSLAGPLAVEAYFLLIQSPCRSLPDVWMRAFGNSADFRRYFHS